MVHEVVVGYRATLLLEDGTIVSEVSVNETRAFFEELKAFTAYILEVEALVSSPLKLPLVSNISFRTGTYVRTHDVHAEMQPTLFIPIYAHSLTQCYIHVCMHVCMHYGMLYAVARRVGGMLNKGTTTACIIKNE